MITTSLTRTLLFTGALYCLSALNPGHAMSKENAPVRYYLSVSTSGIPALIRVNGVPLIKATDEGLVTTEPVHGWLMEGENTLGIELKTPPNEGTQAVAEVTLYLHDPEARVPTPKTVLAEFLYPKPTTSLPLQQDIAFTVPEPLPTRLWAEAETLTEPSADDKTQILALVNRLQDNLLNKDIDAALRLQDYKITDDARAEGKPVAQMREGVTLSLQWLAEQGDLSGAPLDGAAAVFELCADKRLVYVSRQDGEEAVAIESEELFFDVPVYAARVNGEWLIVR